MVKTKRAPSGVVVYVEGGAKGELAGHARRSFKILFERLGLAGRLPRVYACGGRGATFAKYREHLANDEGDAILLVDAEETLSTTPWKHVKTRVGDGWDQPPGATDNDLHFMAVVMETWCLSQFDHKQQALESLDKSKIYKLLAKHTTWSTRNKTVSFDLLEKIDTNKLRTACLEFERLAKRLGT